MRTTIDIDDDLLQAAKELARRENLTAGQIVSRLLREGLTGVRTVSAGGHREGQRRAVAGFKPFTGRGKAVTNEQVNALRDSEGV
jgi:Arc/MetJ family transcription regulator